MSQTVIEYKGELWTTKKISIKGKRTIAWARKRFREVKSGSLKMKKLLEICDKNVSFPDGTYSFLSFTYDCEKTGKEITVSPKMIADRVEISRVAAANRIKNAQKGKRNPQTLFDPPGSAVFSSVEREEIPEDRLKEMKQNQEDIERIHKGELTINEVLKRDRERQQGAYEKRAF